MSLLDIFKKKNSEEAEGTKVGGMEDFMLLIRVYYQSVMAANLGINNLALLPDLRIFKQTLHVPTVNNKLGIGEKNRAKKMLIEQYGLSDNFFKEIDQSIKRNCKNINAVQSFFVTFQAFSQELMMLVSSVLGWKMRVPSFMMGMFRSITDKAVSDIMTKNNWSKDDQRKSVFAVRQYAERLGHSQEWMSEYVYNVIALAKKEPPKQDAKVNG